MHELLKGIKVKPNDGAEFAKAFALKLVSDYPHVTNVQDLMDIAWAEGRFEDESEALAVWGRVIRLLPQKENKK
jgi:hypothetical protein